MMRTPLAPRRASASLATAWRRYRRAFPNCRTCDAAIELGVREVDLIASECGTTSIRLRPLWGALMPAFDALGRVRIVVGTRAAWVARCTSAEDRRECRGWVDLVDRGGHTRLGVADWGSAFVVREERDGQTSRTIRCFDHAGACTLEVHVPREGWDALDRLADVCADTDQGPTVAVRPRLPTADLPNDDIDVAALRASWDALTPDTQFQGVLTEFGISRTQAYRLAGASRAEPLERGALEGVLHHAAVMQRTVVLRTFVGDTSCAHVGPLRALERCGGAVALRGQCCTALLHVSRFASCWTVMRPGIDSPAIVFECFDADDMRVFSLALPHDRHVDYL